MGEAAGHCSPDTQPPTAPAHSVWGHLSTTTTTTKNGQSDRKWERAELVFVHVDYLESAAVDYGSGWLTELFQHIS